MATHFYGYSGKVLRVNLNNGTLTDEALDEATLKKYLGGTGLGAKFLYDGVAPGVEWSAPENLIVFASGPLGGTIVPGSGAFSVVTKGSLTEGATSSQANGYFGAYLKLSGFDAVIIEGVSEKWVYLYIHNGIAELVKADHLVGKDTLETKEAIKTEIGLPRHSTSVFSIGPAGENLVRFAAIVGDGGHVIAHNGPGAVMGSKKLKAIAVARGERAVSVKNKQLVSAISKEIVRNAKARFLSYEWGTSMLYSRMMELSQLPIKNLTTGQFPEWAKFTGEEYRPRLEMKRSPCWACQAHHCHIVKVLEGPYAGYIGEEPEYEGLAGFGSNIGQTDVGAAIMLSNETDRLGMDGNEASWLTSMLMECYEKGIIGKKDTDGIELTWGNAEAVRTLLRRVAHRQGFGNMLADGVLRAARTIGGEAPNIGVYVNKGSTPRMHDHRAFWVELFDNATSNVGTCETGSFVVFDPFSPEEVSTGVARCKGSRFFKDSLVVCLLSTGTYLSYIDADPALERLITALNGVTGWDFDLDEARKVGLRAANLLRVFNIKHGITPKLEVPSPRYGSAPEEGVAKGVSIMPHWEQMIDNFYQQMGWDKKTGKPLPETLRALDLEYVIADL